MTSPVLGKPMGYGSTGRCRSAGRFLLKALAYRPRPEDSAPDKHSEEG